ncbi:MAG: PrsW family intramembrane metalloprotease [Clostridiales bacterium]|nr:PrsW family intramembrane metalloprotease [Candidatus Equinaster intestinalis]
MGNLNLILFISFAAPLLMTLFVCKGKARTLLFFLFIGMVVCLFCGEFSAFIMKMLPFDRQYYTSNFTPFFEEVFKALPILVYAFMYKPKKRTLLECSILVGVGFAMLENAFILGSAAATVSVVNALIRGFGAGMMHGVCTLAIGYGMTFVHTRRKLFYTGTVALLAVAMIYHSLYNTIVQSSHQLVGFLLPVITFIPVLVLLNKTEEKKK